ncbi:hypothetical protein BC829DRAFT_415128 [Chytridium lagenaria]|nr:hypothetical protein BC829DRAFT_415128 [Chytridium lagenaria]
MRAKNVPRTQQFYTTLLTNLGKSGRLSHTILDEMAADGVSPNVYIYNTFISTFVKNGEYEKAVGLKETMRKHGIEPDATTFNIFLEGFLSRGQWDKANTLLTEMSAANIKRDIVTFNTLISAHARRDGGDPKHGAVLFNELTNPPPTSQTYDVYLRALAEESVAVINPVPVVEAIQKVVKTMGDNGGNARMEEAKRYYDVFGPTTPFVDSDGVNSAMITALENAGDYAGAVAWADSKVPASGTGKAVEGGSSIGRSSTYALMVAHAKRRKGAEMEAVWKQLKRLERCYCNLGYIDKAMEMWRSAFKGGNAGKVDERRRIVKSTAASKGLVDRFGVDRITVSLIIDIVGAHGTRAQLEAVWEEIKEAGFPMDLNNWISYLESLARLGFDGEVVETVKREMNGLGATEKVFWSTLPLMRNREESKRLWGVLKENYGGLEKGVRVKMANYLMENLGWIVKMVGVMS